jgi:phospholipid/cholesterol/gamma-HCH transport system substrate-binding protein
MGPSGPPRARRHGLLSTRAGRRIAGLAMIAVGVLVLVIAATRPEPFAHRQTIWAKFDNVNGLGSIDRDVRVAGVNEGEIGIVKRIGDDALVELDVDDEIVLHTDAQVELRPHTLFEGSAFVDLRPGSPSAPVMSPGATIPRSQTRVYVSFDEALRVLRKPVRERLQRLFAASSGSLEGDAPKSLQRTLRAAPELTRDLGPTARALQGSHRNELEAAVAGSAKTVNALARREASLAPLAERASRTLGALDVDGGSPLERALAELPGPLETLRDRGAELTALIDRIDRLSVALRPGLSELAPTLRDLRPVLIDGTPVIRRALPLVHAVRVVLRRATRAAPDLSTLLDTLAPAQSTLADSVLPALNRKSRLGVPTYMQLISAFAGGDAALRPYQTAAQGELGTGHMFRFGTYIDPVGSATLLPCSIVAVINPDVAAQVEAAGFCAP